MAQTICKVCLIQFAKYTCPRCNLQYCSLNCYKKHGDRCTEGFHSENVEKQLRQTITTDEEKRKMMEILRRFNESDETLPGSDMIEEGEESGAEEGAEEGLSVETLAKLMAQIEQGQDVEIQESDLSPEDLAAFERAVASGSLARLVVPWQPWWRTQEAAQISLSTAGTRIIYTQSTHEEPAGPSTDIGVIPPPPSTPLPLVATLSKAQPSPLLRWQLVEILYSYCLTMHMYNGDWTSHPQGAAVTAMEASAALGGRQDSAAPSAAPPPASAAEAVLECLARTCHPSLCGPASRRFAVSTLDDVQTLLHCGRPAIVCALTDLRRLFAAALEEAGAAKAAERLKAGQQSSRGSEHKNSGAQEDSADSSSHYASQKVQELTGASAPAAKRSAAWRAKRGTMQRGSGGGSVLRKWLQAAERKLSYFQSWANEQHAQGLQVILDAVAGEARMHGEGLQADDELRGSAGAAAVLHPSGVSAYRQVPQQAGIRPQLVQELGAKSWSSTEGVRSSDDCGSARGSGAKSDGHQQIVSAALLHPDEDILRDSSLNPGQHSETVDSTQAGSKGHPRSLIEEL
ncbi:probable zinc finger HIT domain-containing protein 2 at N-terminal half [Coccomyxa sp. Obi]|nr:probable zinc finger HIT domain-containing protein 2 at N-terminal half [Coccomyxa sp. Obi]